MTFKLDYEDVRDRPFIGVFTPFPLHTTLRRQVAPHAPEPQPIERYDDMDWAEKYLALTGHDPLLCPHCKKGRMELVPINHIQLGGNAGIAIQQTHTGERQALGPPQAECVSQTT